MAADDWRAAGFVSSDLKTQTHKYKTRRSLLPMAPCRGRNKSSAFDNTIAGLSGSGGRRAKCHEVSANDDYHFGYVNANDLIILFKVWGLFSPVGILQHRASDFVAPEAPPSQCFVGEPRQSIVSRHEVDAVPRPLPEKPQRTGECANQLNCICRKS